ncbi:PREDICTED: uncharacterized protein LOC106725119 [Myotis brandtii]|uniref:uncharacterized protein LOC106725119 n=1 Tax=Myotis brandtii TaxID=109478 RepID=UPI0007044AF0|nr:PREDICTED: uncharacterized protein LOC106725119 [Myotis brandtii]
MSRRPPPPPPSPPVEEMEDLDIEDHQPQRWRRPRHRRAHPITWSDMKALQEEAQRMAPDPNPSAGTLFLLMCAIIATNSTGVCGQEVWAAIPHPGVLLPVAVNSPQFPVIRASNCTLGLPCDRAGATEAPWNGTLWANISTPDILKWTLEANVAAAEGWTLVGHHATGDFLMPNVSATSGTMIGLNGTYPLALSNWSRPVSAPIIESLCPYLFQTPHKAELPLTGVPWEDCLRASQVDGQTKTLGIWGKWLRKGMQPFAIQSPMQALRSQLGRWDLCGPSACLDMRPFFGLQRLTLYNGTWNVNAWRWEGNIMVYVNRSRQYFFEPCVRPPFYFFLSNYSAFNCTHALCSLSNCWSNPTRYAVAVRNPAILWVPATTPDWEGPSDLIIHRDFARSKKAIGLVILLISTIIGAIAGAATGVTSLVTTQLTTSALNTLSESTAQAFTTQASINQQIWGAIINLQQQIDLLVEEIAGLWQLTHTTCDIRFPSICVTTIPVPKVWLKESTWQPY